MQPVQYPHTPYNLPEGNMIASRTSSPTGQALISVDWACMWGCVRLPMLENSNDLRKGEDSNLKDTLPDLTKIEIK